MILHSCLFVDRSDGGPDWSGVRSFASADRDVSAPECHGEHPMSEFDALIPGAPTGRFEGIERSYTAADVRKLRGSVPIAYTLAERGANRLWDSLRKEPFVNALGAVTGN